MLGYNTMKECGIWMQLENAGEVKLILKESGASEQRIFTESTDSEDYNIVKFILGDLKPGTKYTYELEINSKKVEFDDELTFTTQNLWQYRTDPPSFSFAVGSCTYINETELDRPGDPYGGNYEIYESIAEKKPDFMLWTGDNTYLRDADWNSESGIYHRFAHSRDVVEMEKLLRTAHHYAIWDDHDYGPNNSDGSFWNKTITESAFNDFWLNPNTNLTGEGGITSTFFWGDCQFFMLDNRYFRNANNRNTGEKIVIGDAQMNWLVNALKFSRATFKFIVIGGQFISDAEIYENHANLAPEERLRLLDYIEKEEIKGVVFLSGDRHHTELSKLEREEKYPIYDWTVSPLTSKAHIVGDEGNNNYVEGSNYGERNFGIIKVSGKRNERIMNLELFDSAGKKVWDYEILEKDLK